MKATTLLCAPVLLVGIAAAQNPPAAGGQPTVYHVHFVKAALGKSAQLGDYLKTQDPKAPMPGHFILLRHQDGDSWDYVLIEHLGDKPAIDVNATPPPASARDLGDWHGDTFVRGPAWTQFAQAMGVGSSEAAKTASSVYVVSVYRAAPGHRSQLEELVSTPRGSGEASAGYVLLMHLEGAPWQYLSLDRYNSWQDFANSESKAVAETMKGGGQWFRLRDHAAYHADTLTYRIAP